MRPNRTLSPGLACTVCAAVPEVGYLDAPGTCLEAFASLLLQMGRALSPDGVDAERQAFVQACSEALPKTDFTAHGEPSRRLRSYSRTALHIPVAIKDYV
jgi:hypothetical protein